MTYIPKICPECNSSSYTVKMSGEWCNDCGFYTYPEGRGIKVPVTITKDGTIQISKPYQDLLENTHEKNDS